MSTLKELREKARSLGIKGFSKMNTTQVTEAIATAEAGAAAPQDEGFHAEIAASNGGSVRVDRADDIVTITWLCGDTREFAPDELRAALDRFEPIASRGVYYEDTDRHDYTYGAWLADDQFHGRDYVNGDGNGSVPWGEFKAALEASLASS